MFKCRKGVYTENPTLPFLKRYSVRPQIEDELENVATVYVKEQWERDRQAGKQVTGGLVFRVTLTCLEKHIIKDRELLSSSHPERIKTNEERERLAKVVEEPLSYQERQYQENLRIDVKNIKDNLNIEGLIIIKGKLEERTNIEIRVKLEGLGYKNGSKFLYGQLAEIREFLKDKGYP